MSIVKTSPKELAIALAKSESEKELISLLKKEYLWGTQHWRSYGDNENNFSIIGNQQNSPDAALVEKLINSVDAVLMKEAYINGIDPMSGKAPRNIEEAVSIFFNVPEGRLSNLSASERTILAQNISFIATGKKTKPNYTIIDFGEGQSPMSIPNTLLSLSKSNKLRIPFVQGKFNMGGSGVLQFCGEHNLQLIITKRHPLLPLDLTSDHWGVTVVRREPPSEGKRSSSYTYLAPNNEVLKFKADSLDIFPSKDSAYGSSMSHGTFIKLFEYKIPGLTSIISFDLYNQLSLLMPTIALPIRFYERRNYKGHSLETTMTGLNVRLAEDKRGNLEEGFPISSSLTLQGEDMKLSIVAFKNTQEENYKKDQGIIFTVNGQTHGTLSKAFYSRKSVGMGAIKDSLLIIIDCTNLSGLAREDLFMNSRDRLREGQLKKDIEKELASLISTHPMIREFRERRRNELIENKLSDDKPLSNIIENIMNTSPTLSKLFISGQRLSNPLSLKRTGVSDEPYKGRMFPTYFKVKHNKNKIFTRKVPVNVKTRITFETDAINDYFNRDNQPGKQILLHDGKKVDSYNINLHNGIATLNLSLPKNAEVGEEYTFELKINDETRIEPFKERFKLIADKKRNKNPNGKTGERRKAPGLNKKNTREGKSGLDMPNIMEVERNEWDKYKFDRESALTVDNNGESGYDFYINIDNIHLATELRNKGLEESTLTKQQYKYAMVLIGLAVIKHSESNEDDEDSTVKVAEISKILSPILLPMIDNLGDLKEMDQ